MATWYKFRKIIGRNDLPCHFKKIIILYKKISYNRYFATDCMLGSYSIKVINLVFLFNCDDGRWGLRLNDGTIFYLFYSNMGGW